MLQVGEAVQLTEWVLSHPEIGWIVFGIWLVFELRHPKGRVEQINDRITDNTIVIRALAAKSEEISEEKVDDYLLERGINPVDFYHDDEERSNSGDSDNPR